MKAIIAATILYQHYQQVWAQKFTTGWAVGARGQSSFQRRQAG